MKPEIKLMYLYKISKYGKCRNCGKTKIEYPFTFAVASEGQETNVLLYKIADNCLDGNGQKIVDIDKPTIAHFCNSKTVGIFDVAKIDINNIGSKKIETNHTYILFD